MFSSTKFDQMNIWFRNVVLLPLSRATIPFGKLWVWWYFWRCLPCMLFQATTSSCIWKAFPIYYWGIILYVKKVRDKPPQRESLIDYKLNNALSSIHPKPFNSVLLCMPLFPTKIRREGKSNAIIFHAQSGQLDLNTIDAWYVVSKMSVIFLIIL